MENFEPSGKSLKWQELNILIEILKVNSVDCHNAVQTEHEKKIKNKNSDIKTT